MNYNICLIKPNGYIHSAAFVELAELIGYGLKDLGHSVAININQTFRDAKNIIIGCHLLGQSYVDQVPHDSIIINTEQVYADNTAWNENIFKWVSKFETWDYSERNLLKLNELGAISPKHLRLGFHPRLARIPRPESQDIDVLFYGSVGERRKTIIDALMNTGLRVEAVFGVYGEQRDKLIARSKVVLNLHHYNSKIFEIVRVFYLMTNSKAVVCEIDGSTSVDEVYLNGVCPAAYDKLVEACVTLVGDDKARNNLEEKTLASIRSLPQSELLKTLIE